MVQELKSSLGKVYLTIETDHENRWIFVDWQGYLTADNIKTGAQAYIDALSRAGFSCVLNDTRSVRGPWAHSMDWVINEWAPSAAKAGLRHFAMLTTPETLADSSNATFTPNSLLLRLTCSTTCPMLEPGCKAFAVRSSCYFPKALTYHYLHFSWPQLSRKEYYLWRIV